MISRYGSIDVSTRGVVGQAGDTDRKREEREKGIPEPIMENVTITASQLTFPAINRCRTDHTNITSST